MLSISLATIVFLFIGLVSYAYCRKGDLGHIPGPFLGRFTNLLRVSWVKSFRSHEIYYDLHKQYGDLVLVGPNSISVSDPNAIPVVYPVRKGIPKASKQSFLQAHTRGLTIIEQGLFYRAFMPWTKDGFFPAIFTTQDDDLHKSLKNPIANLYSLSNVITLEKSVDGAISVLFKELDRRFVETSSVFDLCDWLQYFAFEAMGMMTFSSRYGFLESGKDVGGMLDAIWQFMLIVGPMTQVPWMDKLLFKNNLMLRLRPGHGSPILNVTNEKIADRLKGAHGGADKHSSKYEPDLLDRFLDIKSRHPEAPIFAVPAWTFSNVIAGSDSTAVAMKTVMYHLLANQGSLKKLYAELGDAERQKRMSLPYPRWEEVQSLPYLDACVQEALRLHPPFCLPLERVVPEGGLQINGRYIPPGTSVGVHPYVVNRHVPTFGIDANVWRPERWLGLNDEHRRRLDNAVFTFGAGRRVCLGKHVALLEVKKVIPALLLRYEWDFVDPTSYKTVNSYFFTQNGLNVQIRKRIV